ncbi:hypothetical protein ABB02_00817 [Clostridiaceae bacterium JG1575]|nr:hypothetical protein ABB02_00817 [Clostridiaceae bacterium JG1575]
MNFYEAKNDMKNCRHCPSYGQDCSGGALDCLCLRCPRNLGMCLKVRYCRETESVLDLTQEKTQEPREDFLKAWRGME